MSAAAFADWAKNPAWASDPVAASLLTVVSEWIQDHKPDIAADDPAAQLVCFEVTRDSLLAGELGPVVSFTKTAAHRTRSATIDRAALERFITDRHRRMLGLPLRAGPRGCFKAGDY
ncbi:hypothetical protein K6T79_09640 [Mycolicibacter sp. MYC098]|uniref:Head-to-tail adaptor n=1 Tax=[Mycobacterium] crassicus TaxID=2872309 RepID=A0ABU5XG95_9MYCO|nr:hypothetical protein [Mycolicibacter sp. MYC098]MEB3021308.1 hypothetical protein [Mycolicibacter sp. MYC098]